MNFQKRLLQNNKYATLSNFKDNSRIGTGRALKVLKLINGGIKI